MRNRILLGSLLFIAGTMSSALAAQATFNGTGGGFFDDTSPTSVTFNVSGLFGTGVSSVSLGISLHHSYAGDVTITLTDPQSNVHTIVERIGYPTTQFGDSSEYGNAPTHGMFLFADTGTADIWADFAAETTGGQVTPSGVYRTSAGGTGAATTMNTVFNGLSAAQANGTWTLSFTDFTGGDSGDANAASSVLTITGPSSTPVAPIIISTAPTAATTGTLYLYTVSATGAPVPTFTIAGTLPGWLTWDNFRTLSGTPGAGDIGTAGPFTITATNTVNPDDTEAFSIVVSAPAPEPEIDITDPNSKSVASGGTVTYTGSAAGTPIATATFTITNSGNADLTISAATTGTDSNGASNMSAAPAATVTASNTTTFDVGFTPTNAGAWSTVITITNNDTNEGTYTITLSGTAQATAAPEIAVEDPANVDITNGSTESVTNTSTTQFSRVYTILNTGVQALNLIGTAGSEVVISGQNNCTVTVTQPANTTLPAAGVSPTTEAFTLVITPTAAGLFSFNVSIANTDANENPFNWTFSGNTTAPITFGGGGGGGGCTVGTTGNNVWFALLGLLGLVAVIRVRRVTN